MKKGNREDKFFSVVCISALLVVGALIVFALVSNLRQNGNTKRNEANSETGTEPESYEAVPKPDFSQVDPQNILKLPFDYTNDDFFQELEVPDVTAEQVNSELSGYLSAYPVYEKVMDRGVKEGDLINVDYSCIDKETGISVTDGTRQSLLLDLKDNDLPQDVLDAFSGVMPGASFQKEAVIDAESEGTFTDDEGEAVSVAGRTLAFSFTINYICGAERTADNVTDADIEEITEGDYHTVPEFLEFIRTNLTRNAEDSVAEEVWDRWAESCMIGDEKEFNHLVEEEMNYEMGFYQSMAESRGIDMDSLALLYGSNDVAAFKETVQADSAKIVKQYLVAYYVSGKEGLHLDDAGFLRMQEELAKEYGLGSVDELKETYGDVELRLFLQMERVSRWIAEEIHKRGEE